MTRHAPQSALPLQESCVFRSDAMEVMWHPGPSAVLLITFSEMGMRANGRHWWAASVARKLGMAALGFVAARPNWFPAGAMAETLAAPTVSGILASHRRRIAYGFSMGGYAAIRFGRAVGADAAVAIAPQWSIDPADTGPRDPRFTRFYDSALHAGMRIGPGHAADRTYIIFDPREMADQWNVGRITEAAPDAVLLHARATGHWTSAALASSVTSSAMFAGALSGDAAAIGAAIRARRRSWPRRRLILARQLSRTRPGLAMRLAAGAPPQGHESDLRAIFEGAAEGFLRRNDAVAAQDAAGRAFALAPDSSHAVAMLAEAALRQGEGERALALARQSVALAPNSPGARFRLAAFLRQTGHPAEAEDERLRAEALRPHPAKR